jgi:hypothetical protein
MVMRLQGETEIAFATLALVTLEGNFLEALKLCTPVVDALSTCTDRRQTCALVLALFEAADALTRDQLGVPLKPEFPIPPELRTQ